MEHWILAEGTPGWDGFKAICSCGGWAGYRGTAPFVGWASDEWRISSENEAVDAFLQHVKLTDELCGLVASRSVSVR